MAYTANSFSISYLLGTVQLLHSNWTVSVLSPLIMLAAWQHGDWAAYGGEVTVLLAVTTVTILSQSSHRLVTVSSRWLIEYEFCCVCPWHVCTYRCTYMYYLSLVHDDTHSLGESLIWCRKNVCELSIIKLSLFTSPVEYSYTSFPFTWTGHGIQLVRWDLLGTAFLLGVCGSSRTDVSFEVLEACLFNLSSGKEKSDSENEIFPIFSLLVTCVSSLYRDNSDAEIRWKYKNNVTDSSRIFGRGMGEG